jgi:hypothetical protein
MSKAITGAVELAGAVGMVAAAYVDPALILSPTFDKIMVSLAIGGVAMEAGALASSLTANRGMNITTRQPAAQRQVCYGPQRVGGILIWESTTGSSKRQFNKVIPLSGHQMDIEAIYLDGRRVWFDESSSGSRTYNGFTFGGSANGNTYTGPDGQRYNFGGLVYAEMRDGSQVSGDVMGSLTANDPSWVATSDGNPYVGGCCYIYLKVEGDANMFPQEPEVRLTVHGKPCWDPRISAYLPGCSNPALIAADILTDSVFGLGDSWDSVYSGAAGEQLIAAANVCDQQVYSPNAAAYESLYACGIHYDSATGAADALTQVMDAMGGRLSRIGGQWYIFPAYWQGPSFSFDYTMLTSSPSWTPYRKLRELNNRVRGTFTSPNYPYNVAGNAYDANGFDSDGNAQNNFSFAWQTASGPQYAVDPQHGYAADQYLNEDSGAQGAYDPTVTYVAGFIVSYITTIGTNKYCTCWSSNAAGNHGNTPGPGSTAWTLASRALVDTFAAPAILSIAQWQRLAKIRLLRNRQQGSGSFELRISALGMQPLDVMSFTWPQMGWADKTLEIVGCSPFRVVEGQDGEPPSIRATFKVQETDASVYEWDPETEEQNIYDVPAIAPAQAYIVAPPTDMTIISSAAIAIVAPDGSVTPRAEITWDTPGDAWATQIQTQYKLTSSAAWSTGPVVDIALNAAYVTGIVAGEQFDFQIRTLRPNGAASVWVQVLGVTVGLVLSVQTASGVGIGSLIGEAYTDGTAAIECNPFTFLIGQMSLSIFPGGAVTLTGLTQQTLYYVYYQDPTYAGGNVTPVATTNPADYLGKLGYFLIAAIITPYVASGGASGSLYYPSTYQDLGSRTTLNPTSAFDGDSGSYATVSGSATSSTSASGDFIMQGDPGIVLSAASTLNLDLVIQMSGLTVPAGTITVDVTIPGTTTTPLSFTAATARTVYPFTVPAGTLLSGIIVEVQAVPNASISPHPNLVQCLVYENSIQS